jgi:tetratricopeptide (TPR) repeat protein
MNTDGEQFLSITTQAFRDAVQDYFAPLLTWYRWLRSLIQLPLSVQENTFSSYAILDRHHEVLGAVRGLSETTTAWLDEVRRLSSTIEALSNEQKRQLPVLLESLEARLESLSEAQAELAVTRFLEVANSMRRLGETSKAAEVLQLLGRLSERHHLQVQSYAWFNLGEVFFERSDEHRAESYYSRVIQRGEFDDLVAAANDRLAIIFYSRDRFVEAASLAERAIEIYERIGNRESVSKSYIQLVRSLLAQGDTRRASEALKRASRLLLQPGNLIIPHK